MNPIYRFLIRQKTTNLIDPFSCYQISEGMMGTGLMKVESGETYVLAYKDGTILPMQNIFLYDVGKHLVWSTTFAQNDIEIPENVVYLETIFPLGMNPLEVGVFKTPFTQFESYFKAITNPLYRDDLGVDYALESNQEFYRGKLSGKLTFQGADFEFIRQQAFDQQFDLEIHISYDNGVVWAKYWAGQFWKTDCQFNEDDKTAIVTPNVTDDYIDVLAGMDKEFNLIELAPEIIPVKADKRSLIQVYVPGQKVIGCFLSNMWWEQECEAISNESDLVNTYHFQNNIGREIAIVSGDTNPQLPLSFSGAIPNRTGEYGYYFNNGDYQLLFGKTEVDDTTNIIKWEIIRRSDGVALWRNEAIGPLAEEPSVPYSVGLTPVPDSGATGNVTLQYYDVSIYARRVHNVSNTGYNLPANDLVENNRNYTKVSPVDVSDQLIVSSTLQSTPTEWGIYQPGYYYVMPYNSLLGPTRCYPVARAMWSEVSFWFAVSQTDWQTEPAWRTEFEIKDCFPIYSVISVLLAKVAPGITHEGTTDYSSFLYGGRPLNIPNQRVFITPKTNITTSGYDQPAQKAPITLKRVLDMLRDCFRCYWWIDSQRRFRIEHIEYFRNGGSYDPAHVVIGRDLTQEVVVRNGKPWAYATKKYQFDKPDMAAWYQFGWMDNSTELFNGMPLEIVSRYVNPDKIENIEIPQFTSDVDYMLLTPGDVSQDGFALLVPVLDNGEYKLPYFTFTINHVDYVLQNAYAAFVYLQLHYRWDMPAKKYRRNGELETAKGVKKLKTQTINFPALHDPELMQLIKTSLGNGTIQKITINLSARNAKATLKYDTE